MNRNVIQKRDSYNSLHRLNEKKKQKDKKKLQNELYITKTEFEDSIAEFQAKLRDTTANCRFDFIQRLAAFIYSNKGCYQQGMTVFEQIGDDLVGIMNDMEDAKAEFMSNKDKQDHRISMFVTQTQESGLVKQGYLYKLAQKKVTKSLKNWNIRWYQLKDGVLSWFTKWKDTTPSGQLNLRLCSLKIIPDKPLTFEITQAKPEVKVVLRGLTENDYKEWVETIKNAISYALSKDEDDIIELKKKRNESFDLSYYDDDNESFISTLYSYDDKNKECADCGKENPDWTSINIGSIICIECSGIHRSLGSHVSKVRSLKMDKLKKEIQSFLLCMGNSIVNRIFEGNLHNTKIGDDRITKPTPKSSEEEKRNYIRMKYVDKLFMISNYSNKQVSKEEIQDFIGNYPFNSDSNKYLKNDILDEDEIIISTSSSAEDRIRKLWSLFFRGYFSPLSDNLVIDDRNRSLVHIAAEIGDTMVVSFFVLNGYKSSYEDNSGRIALHYAAKSGSMEMCEILANRNDIHVRDNDGKSPIDLAKECDSEESAKIVEFLNSLDQSSQQNKKIKTIKAGQNRKRSWTLTTRSKDNSHPTVIGLFSKKSSDNMVVNEDVVISRPTTFRGAEQAKTLRLKTRDLSMLALDNLLPRSSDDSSKPKETPKFKRKSRSLPGSPSHKQNSTLGKEDESQPEKEVRKLKHTETSVHIRKESLDTLNAREFWKKLDEKLELKNREQQRRVLKRSTTLAPKSQLKDMQVNEDNLLPINKIFPVWKKDNQKSDQKES